MSVRIRSTEAETTERVFQIVRDSVTPMTLEEMAQATGLNYYTVRKHIGILMERNLVEVDDYTKNRATLFRLVDQTKTPKFHYAGQKKPTTSMDQAFDAFTETVDSKLRSRGSLVVADVHARLYALAAKLKVQGVKNVPHQELSDIKDELIAYRSLLEVNLTMVNEILAQKRLWDRGSLIEALLSDGMSVEEAQQKAALVQRNIEKARAATATNSTATNEDR